MEEETKEHYASKLVNSVLESRQLLHCGVQKTHWLNQEAMLKDSGYVFLCYGHEDGVHYDRVTLALAPKVATSLLSWEGCGPCLLRTKLLLEKGLHLWVIVAYAHIATNPNDVTKDQFYDTFSNLVVAIPARNVTLILGDFNV